VDGALMRIRSKLPTTELAGSSQLVFGPVPTK
jgi:hypothetical protein